MTADMRGGEMFTYSWETLTQQDVSRKSQTSSIAPSCSTAEYRILRGFHLDWGLICLTGAIESIFCTFWVLQLRTGSGGSDTG